MSELSRTSSPASRHRQLGSELEDWNGTGTAWSYDGDEFQGCAMVAEIPFFDPGISRTHA